MYTIKSKIRTAFMIGIAGGIMLAFFYVNPHGGSITLSEFVLQLSGSRGEFILGTSFSELIPFVMRMIPGYVFEMFIGIELYRHFCTASIYVFSRKPNRVQWYIKEVMGVGLATVFYQVILLGASMIVTVLRYRLELDTAGFILLFYHFVLYTIWIFSVSLILNFVAIFAGSDTSFLVVYVVQAVFIAILQMAKIFEDNARIVHIWLNINPMAHLVLGWHTSNMKSLSNALGTLNYGLSFRTSIVMMSGICILTVGFGLFTVKKHDFLITDSEIGGI